MNNYCRHLNINLMPVREGRLSEIMSGKKGRPGPLIEQKDMTPEIIDFFDSLGLVVKAGIAFYEYGELNCPDNFLPIHTDCAEMDDIVNINWIYFQADSSTMNWYRFIDQPVYGRISRTGRTSSYVAPEHVEIAHSEKIKSPSMVQAGIPHNITVGPTDRLCVSLYVSRKSELNKLLTWTEALDMYRDFLD